MNPHAAGARIQCFFSDQHEFYHFDVHSNLPWSTDGSDSPAIDPVRWRSAARYGGYAYGSYYLALRRRIDHKPFKRHAYSVSQVAASRKCLSLKIGPVSHGPIVGSSGE